MKSQGSTEFTHLDDRGQVRLVDVGDKPVTRRQATALGSIYLGDKIYPLLMSDQLEKGDAFAAARLAGIMAIKNTANLIPLCHPLPLTGIEIDFIPQPEQKSLAIKAQVRTQAQTGVEMEALVGVAVAALTIYDMCKAIDRNMVIEDIMLIDKSGGKSGAYHRPGEDGR
ncbi:MAG: cyclic pyranopterin monophosphate synthase MoaC [Desulfobacca sp.]|nr:cyclic pyranopterin monophosphate synthase MoaC [Desulfobacca sp.]